VVLKNSEIDRPKQTQKHLKLIQIVDEEKIDNNIRCISFLINKVSYKITEQQIIYLPKHITNKQNRQPKS